MQEVREVATRQEIKFNWEWQSSDASQQAGGTSSLGPSLDKMRKKADRMKLIASIGNGFEVVISLPSTTLTIYDQLEPNGRPTKRLNRETVHANSKTFVTEPSLG